MSVNQKLTPHRQGVGLLDRELYWELAQGHAELVFRSGGRRSGLELLVRPVKGYLLESVSDQQCYSLVFLAASIHMWASKTVNGPLTLLLHSPKIISYRQSRIVANILSQLHFAGGPVQDIWRTKKRGGSSNSPLFPILLVNCDASFPQTQ